MVTLGDNLSKKQASKFYCEKCDYGTSRKYELVSPRALKHIKNLEAYSLTKSYKTNYIFFISNIYIN
jgi:hypothetical protein